MALNRAAQEKALKALKYSDADIKKFLDDAAEVDLTIPELHVYSPADLAELEANTRKGYIKEDAASEIWCRKMNKDHDLKLTGDDARNPDRVSAALKAKWAVVQDETETAKKFKELQESFGAKEAEILTYKQQLEATANERLYRKMFFKDMSDALDEDEWITRLQRTFELKKDGEIIGLVDRMTGKLITDAKKNTLPYLQAWEQLRAAEADRFKTWIKAEPVASTPDPTKATHDPRKGRNPALNNTPKYKNDAEIVAEVDKKFPPEKKGEKNWLKNRQQLFRELKAMSA